LTWASLNTLALYFITRASTSSSGSLTIIESPLRKKISVSGVDSIYLMASRFNSICELSNLERLINDFYSVITEHYSQYQNFMITHEQGENKMDLTEITARMREAQQKFDQVWRFL